MNFFIKKLFNIFIKIKNKFLIFIFYHSYLSAKYNKKTYQNLKSDNQFVLLTIAFNNPEILDIQISMLKKNLNDSFQLLIFDNSTNKLLSEKNREICQKYNTTYLRLCKLGNIIAQNPSISHGLALNRALRFACTHTFSQYIGILDHDVFPIVPTSLCKKLQNKLIYGLLQKKEDFYYWPGFLFLERDLISISKFNFLPPKNSDTGGYLNFLLNIPQNQQLHAEERYITIRKDIDFSHQNCTISCIDDWVHTRNASYWYSGPPKEKYIRNFLQELYSTDKQEAK